MLRIKTSLRLIAAVACSGVWRLSAQSPDAVTAAPETHRVVVENQYVRVLETRLVANQSIPTHSHPARVTVVLADARTRERLPSGRLDITDRAIGNAVYADPVEHAVDVIAGDLHEIEVEIKPA